MKKNFIWFLLTGISILFAAAAFFSGRHTSIRNSSGNIRKNFPVFRSEEVRHVTISWRKIQTNLIFQNGTWVIAERNNLPASPLKVAELLSELSSLAPVKELLPVNEDLLKQLHLNTEDDPENVPGIRITLKDNREKPLFSIVLGRGHFTVSEPGLPPAERPEGRYAAVNGKVYLLPRIFEQCHPVPGAWIPEIFLTGAASALHFSNSGDKESSWCVSRKNAAQPYELLYPAGKTLELQKLSAVAGLLSNPFAGDYFTGDVSKLKFEQTFRMFTPDGFRYTIQFAAVNSGTDCIRLLCEFQEDKVLPRAGESQHAAALRRQKLQARARAEKQNWNNRYFVVRKEFRKTLSQPPVK